MLLFGHPQPRLPRAHAWLIRQVQPTAIGYGHLHAIFDDPDFAAFLAAVPRAARILRPLCTALGFIPPAALRLPPRPPRPRRPAPPKPPRITAAERRHLLNYSPGPLRHLRKPA